MNLAQVIQALDGSGELKVPEWLPGAYRRQYIHFHDGRTDSAARVFWLQSGGLTIDLRLPAHPDSADEPGLRYQGWSADSVWQADQLSWESFTSLHERDLWPEPAMLDRVGLHLIERAPSGVYLEDWLALQSQPGPLAGFRLRSIKLPGETGWRECGGALIVAGDWAGWVLDVREIDVELSGKTGFITRIARRSSESDFVSVAALDGADLGKPLLPEGQFVLKAEQLIHAIETSHGVVELAYEVDLVRSGFDFVQASTCSSAGAIWYQAEQNWLSRR